MSIYTPRHCFRPSVRRRLARPGERESDLLNYSSPARLGYRPSDVWSLRGRDGGRGSVGGWTTVGNTDHVRGDETRAAPDACNPLSSTTARAARAFLRRSAGPSVSRPGASPRARARGRAVRQRDTDFSGFAAAHLLHFSHFDNSRHITSSFIIDDRRVNLPFNSRNNTSIYMSVLSSVDAEQEEKNDPTSV